MVASSCFGSRACLVGGGLYLEFISTCVALSFSITVRFFPLLRIFLKLPSQPLVLLSQGIYLFFVLVSQFLQLGVHLSLQLRCYCILINCCSCRHHPSWELSGPTVGANYTWSILFQCGTIRSQEPSVLNLLLLLPELLLDLPTVCTPGVGVPAGTPTLKLESDRYG